MALPVVLPTNKPKDRNFVRGYCRAFLADYLTTGTYPPDTGSGAAAYVGQIKNGGFTMSGAIEWAENVGQEQLSASSVNLVRHPKTFKFTLTEPVIEMLAILEGAKATTSAALGVSTLTVGNVVTDPTPDIKKAGIGGIYDAPGSFNLTPYRLLVERPVEGDATTEFGLRGLLYFYKVYLRLGGDVSVDRENATELAVDGIACWDWTVTPALGGPGRLYQVINALTPNP